MAAHRLSLVVASRATLWLWDAGFSLQWLLLWSTGSRGRGSSSCSSGLKSTGSTFVMRGLCCSVACGYFPDQGSNLCPLHWQEDSYPLPDEGSPFLNILELIWMNVNYTKMNIRKKTGYILEKRINNVLGILGKWLELKGEKFIEENVGRKEDPIHSKKFIECLWCAKHCSRWKLNFQELTV